MTQTLVREFHVDSFKALTNDRPGTFEAVVSVFDTIDNQDEVIVKGAFEESIANAKGPTPVVWSHQWLTPPIGVSLSETETEKGLKVKGRFFVDGDEAVPLAQHVYTAMKAGALREWSFSGAIKSERQEERDGRSVRVLEKIDLVELGPCIKGVNPDTYTIGVKSADITVDAERFAEAIAKAMKASSTPVDKEDVAPSDKAPSGATITPDEKRRIFDVLV